MSSTYDVILPAGGRIDPVLAAAAGTDIKALIKFDGETILQRTLEALKESGLAGRTVVIGAEETRAEAKALGSDTLEEGSSGPENIYRGLEFLLKANPSLEKIMLVTTDLPFLTPEILHRFVELCPTDRDICVPLVSQSQYEARFPGSTATFVKLKEKSWTTGCAFIMNVQALSRIRPQIERVFEQRKNKLGMAKLLGAVFAIKFLTKSLTIDDVEKKIKSLLGCTGSAVRNSPAELAFDIDYLDDYEYAIGQLKQVAKA